MTKLPAAPSLPYTFHATLREYWRRLGLWRVLLAFGLTFLIFIRGGFLVWLGTVVALAVLIAGILFFLGRRSVTLTPEQLEYKNALGRMTAFPYAEMKGAKVFVNYYEPSFGVAPRIIIGQKNNKKIVSLTGLYWPAEELEKLMVTLDKKKVKMEYFEELATAAVVTRQFPDYTTYAQRHPFALGLYIGLGILVAALGVAAYMTFYQ